MQTHELIDQLKGEVQPVQRLSCPRVRFMRWVLVTLVYVGCAAWLSGIRPDLTQLARQGWFWVDTGLLMALVVMAGFFALCGAIPGLERNSRPRRFAWWTFGVWTGLISIRLLLAWFSQDSSAFEPHLGSGCVRSLIIFGTPPAITLIWMQRKGLALQEEWAGTLGVLAAAGCGALGLQLTCSSCSLFHLLLTHALPVFVLGVLVGPLVGKWALRHGR